MLADLSPVVTAALLTGLFANIAAAVALFGVAATLKQNREIARDQHKADFARDQRREQHERSESRREERPRVYAEFLGAVTSVLPRMSRLTEAGDATTPSVCRDAVSEMTIVLQEVFLVGSPDAATAANRLFLATMFAAREAEHGRQPNFNEPFEARGAFVAAARADMESTEIASPPS